MAGKTLELATGSASSTQVWFLPFMQIIFPFDGALIVCTKPEAASAGAWTCLQSQKISIAES